jgi:hypothetical protein
MTFIIADRQERRVLPNGVLLITDFERGIALICDPEAGRICRCCGKVSSFWDVTIGYEVVGTEQMQQPPFKMRLGFN